MTQNHQIDWTEVDRDLLNYRKDRFRVEVAPTRHPSEEGEIDLSVTRNGNHWVSISLLKSEVPKVIEALQASLR